MSEALAKNALALRAAGGDDASPDLIRTARIGVWFGGGPDGTLPRSVELAAEALGELLGRFWHRMDAGGDGGAGGPLPPARTAARPLRARPRGHSRAAGDGSLLVAPRPGRRTPCMRPRLPAARRCGAVLGGRGATLGA